MTDNVTLLPRKAKRRSKAPLEVVHNYGGCRHEHVEVSEKAAEVTCATCKEKLNPIWVLMRIATDDRVLVDRWAEMKAELRLMRDRKRVKCQHCDKFTPVPSRAGVLQVMELAQKIKSEEAP